MDPSECSLTDISGKSVRHLSPGVNLNQIFHPARHPGCFGCMNSGSFGQDFSHRVEKTSQEFWPPAAVVQHQGVYGGGLHPSGTGPESPRWRCETYQCAAAGATARNPAVGEETYDFDPALEPPLPLRSDDEWLQMAPCLPPQHCLHNYEKVFVTYSSDSAIEVVPFMDFLTQHGFRAAMDIWDSPISRPDGYLLDQPSALIIIAISPNYKADVEGARMDTQSPHTRYIYTMMQNQFIQQGSLNFRFIPVCFLNSSQKHVPSWLQNTRVYLWPQEMEDLLLGLFRAEKYAPPPVSTDLTVTMRPVAPTFADAP
ncbi:adapter protein CIKS-like isoform X3 [Takifugu rubripes]|uniref:adapter protein CIKS-like isoform X3 n=1 Tax=Takifugu rubripes TaxID=31033 RepID=UPI0011452E97|nr:adapter protein CIKS-like isoform X3 [Takifugu rubripes]